MVKEAAVTCQLARARRRADGGCGFAPECYSDCIAPGKAAVSKNHLRPHPEERALARVSKDGGEHGVRNSVRRISRGRAELTRLASRGHPSRRRFAPPQDEVESYRRGSASSAEATASITSAESASDQWMPIRLPTRPTVTPLKARKPEARHVEQADDAAAHRRPAR